MNYLQKLRFEFQGGILLQSLTSISEYQTENEISDNYFQFDLCHFG